MKFLICLSLLFSVLDCQQEPVAPHPTPIVKDTADCPSAEEHLLELCKQDTVENDYCCKTVAPTKKGKSFTRVCVELQNKGVFFNPKCLKSIKSCGEIDRCTQSKN